jgi:uncharacterized repeat protein (TIGR01451 family)
MGGAGIRAVSVSVRRPRGWERARAAVSVAAVAVLGSVGLVAATSSTADALGPNAMRAGFNASTFAGNDDGSTAAVSLPFPVHFFSGTFNQLFLNNNGNVTFDAALSTFTPFDLSTAGRVIIAPFFADVDTRTGNVVTYGTGTVNGHSAWGVNWPGVGCYNQNTSVLNYFQMILINRSDVAAGDFDIEFNYDQIQWDSGQASNGDVNCLGGSSARAGYSDGTSANTFELPGSAVDGAFLDSNATTGLVHNSLNTSQLGRYIFSVRAGQPRTSTTLTTSLSGGNQSGTSISVPTGIAVTDSATLSGTNASSASGTVTYTVFSDNACTHAVADGGTKNVGEGGSVPSSDPVTLTATGTYYWQASYIGDDANAPSMSTCGDEVETVTPPLSTSITGSPNPVSAGNDVKYTVTVHNNGGSAVSSVKITDTLPATTTFVSASAPFGCVGTGPVTCTLGTIAAGGSASAKIIVKTANGSGGTTVTDSATTSPGGGTASTNTQIVTPTAGTTTGFVPPGGSIDTGGNNPAHLALPNTGPGATITLTQVPTGNNFCDGPCNGTATFISNFPGYSDPTHPIDLKLTFADGSLSAARNDFATSTIYKVRDNQTVGVAVPDCSDNPNWTTAQKQAAANRRLLRVGTQSGIANPSPCVDSRTITKVSDTQYKVTFEILYLSDDGGFARK